IFSLLPYRATGKIWIGLLSSPSFLVCQIHHGGEHTPSSKNHNHGSLFSPGSIIKPYAPSSQLHHRPLRPARHHNSQPSKPETQAGAPSVLSDGITCTWCSTKGEWGGRREEGHRVEGEWLPCCGHNLNGRRIRGSGWCSWVSSYAEVAGRSRVEWQICLRYLATCYATDQGPLLIEISFFLYNPCYFPLFFTVVDRG
uniref:Uncharacterized protein n=1 Tax=Triticum urartu TaxID=4572 RepID=A0A8R7VB21_TRIUA